MRVSEPFGINEPVKVLIHAPLITLPISSAPAGLSPNFNDSHSSNHCAKSHTRPLPTWDKGDNLPIGHNIFRQNTTQR
jgi:hypothetical protein